MRRALLDDILGARRDKRAVVLATWLASGEQALLDPFATEAGEDVDEALLEAARAACRDDRSTPFQPYEGGPEVFLQVFSPPVRLIIVGAVHIAQPLARMAREVDFDVVVIDPRRAFATEARFPGVELITQWPDEALAGLSPSRRTAVVTLTHDPKLDDPALDVALRTGAFYIGSLGSTRTHARRLERLRARGFDDVALERIRGPIGLPIGARHPAEIAVAILAEAIQGLRREGT